MPFSSCLVAPVPLADASRSSDCPAGRHEQKDHAWGRSVLTQAGRNAFTAELGSLRDDERAAGCKQRPGNPASLEETATSRKLSQAAINLQG